MNSSPTGSFSIFKVLLLAVPLAIAVSLGTWYYILQVEKEQAAVENPLRSFLRQNLKTPAKLDPGLIDDDGDLVAAAPKDPKNLIEPDTLVFSVLGQDAEREEARYADLAEHLQKATGKKVEVVVWAESIDDQIAALRAGKLHLAALSTGSVSTAVNRGGFVPFCVMADAKGNFGYRMQILVPAGSGAKTPADLKGQPISFVSPYSHSGFKAPVVILWKQFGLRPGLDYRPSIEGSQESVVRGVAEGRFKAGAAAGDLVERMAASGDIDRKSYRVLYESPDTYPSQCFGYAHQLKPELATKIKAGFLDFPWQNSSLAKAYPSQSKFVPISYKTDWAAVRALEEQASQLIDEEPSAKR